MLRVDSILGVRKRGIGGGPERGFFRLSMFAGVGLGMLGGAPGGSHRDQ